MPTCFFASDLHGSPHRYAALFERLADETPAALFLGGDLAPHIMTAGADDFLAETLGGGLRDLRDRLGDRAPRVFTILGNDDPGWLAEDLASLEAEGLLEHVHLRRVDLDGTPVHGCAWTPPTPFLRKDWERYDVGRGTDPGCISPEAGRHSRPVDPHALRYGTIARDLDTLAGDAPQDDAVWLFHAPPYDTDLDRAALDGKTIDHVPLDVHIGSVAIRRFLETRAPAVALCGHVHEAARITGTWRVRLGRTEVLGAAHDGPELALVRFDPRRPRDATRELI